MHSPGAGSGGDQGALVIGI